MKRKTDALIVLEKCVEQLRQEGNDVTRISLSRFIYTTLKHLSDQVEKASFLGAGFSSSDQFVKVFPEIRKLILPKIKEEDLRREESFPKLRDIVGDDIADSHKILLDPEIIGLMSDLMNGEPFESPFPTTVESESGSVRFSLLCILVQFILTKGKPFNYELRPIKNTSDRIYNTLVGSIGSKIPFLVMTLNTFKTVKLSETLSKEEFERKVIENTDDVLRGKDSPFNIEDLINKQRENRLSDLESFLESETSSLKDLKIRPLNDFFSDGFEDDDDDCQCPDCVEARAKKKKDRMDGDDNQDSFRITDFGKFLNGLMGGGFKPSNDRNLQGFTGKKASKDSKTPALDQFAYNMVDAARNGKYDKVVGRDKELDSMIEALNCRVKNNVALIGDPGVGKTAIVEKLAVKLLTGDVPDKLKGKVLYSLNLNSLVAGTQFRGQFEERMQAVIEEVRSNEEIIIFIDEFHNLVGAGSSDKSGDASNILKPYLSRGEFQCIGSTTTDEFKKVIEKDGALRRRFHKILVTEPEVGDVFEILKGVAPKYEEFHHTKYNDEVLRSIVDCSGRYITERFFPDKAIDILDMAGSMASLRKVDNPELRKLDISIKEANEELDKLSREKIKLVRESKFQEAGNIKDKEVIDLIKRLQYERQKFVDNDTVSEVTLKDLYETVAKISNVPVDKIAESDMEKVRSMAARLSAKVIGQDPAVKSVVTSLQRNILGLRDPNKPIASLLMVGPTGVGKSMICKEMAKEFFGTEKALIKFDMGEFGERHEVTKLTGATASYVGYSDRPLLDQIRETPYSVVLFDEIEKASPEIYNIFLSILDEGKVTLGNGVVVDFKNTIVVFTGNIGTKELQMRGKSGFGFGSSEKTAEQNQSEIEDTVMKAVKKTFKPELLNRISKTIVFNELGEKEMDKIFDLELENLSSRLLSNNKWKISVQSSLKKVIVKETDTMYGARDLKRQIIEKIEENLCQWILDNGMPEDGDILDFSWKKDQVVITKRVVLPKNVSKSSEVETV